MKRAAATRETAGDLQGTGSLWSQVKAALVNLIVNTPLPEHAKLPSESELCAQFNVSRTVVREAMNQLVFERMIYRQQGRGAFVASRREDEDFLGSNVGFSGEWRERRRAVARRILRVGLQEADERATHLMRLGADRTVVALDRVLSVDDTPRVIVHTQVVASVAPGLERVQLENRSLYDTLFRRYGIKLNRAERWLSAVTATEEQAALLNVAAGTPLIGIESIGFSAREEPVEYYTGFYRTDVGRLHFSVR